ncbi:MAG TPA: hypothetical protein VFQ37_16695 [Mycobacterium sp.]|nr:hypothetical protein [Mycobacterium sp.]
MALQITGEAGKISERPVTWEGGSFTERTVSVRDWGSTDYVTLGKNFAHDDIPAEGERVVLLIAERLYVNKAGAARCQLIATGRDRDAEAKLFARAAVKAV